jgi:putative ABC transport system substrate-binding protein
VSVVIKNLFIVLFLIFLILGHGSSGAAQEIVAVQSVRVAPYEEAIRGFKNVCDARIKKLVLSELKETDVVEKIAEIRPDMVLAIGMDALSMVKIIETIPIVYLMVLDPQSAVSAERNITGVSMNIPQKRQLRAFLEALPDLNSIGLLYDPERTGYLAENAREAAREIGINLIAKEVHRSGEVPLLIKDMKGKIDAFWMLPDLTVITPETVEYLLLFSLENTVPILTFAKKYVELGALMSVGMDAFDIGTQAGEMAEKILSGRDVKNIQRVDARKAVISINLKVAGKLGVTIDEKVIRRARIIN